jgi:hypothetical protein
MLPKRNHRIIISNAASAGGGIRPKAVFSTAESPKYAETAIFRVFSVFRGCACLPLGYPDN